MCSESSDDWWITLTKASNAKSVYTVMTPLWNHNKQSKTKPWIYSWDVIYQRKLQWRHNGRHSVSNHQPHYYVYLTVYSGGDQRKHQSSASLAFVRSPHKWPVTRKMFQSDDVIMRCPCPYIQASSMGRQQSPEAMDRCLQSWIK